MSPASVSAILIVSSALGPGPDMPVPPSDARLDDAVRRFTRDRQRAVFDLTGGALTISQLLDWYREDLTNPRYRPHAESEPESLSRYVDDSELARSLAEDRWNTTHTEYDWKLNLQR